MKIFKLKNRNIMSIILSIFRLIAIKKLEKIYTVYHILVFVNSKIFLPILISLVQQSP